jgi:hypothetical protein
MRSLRHRPAEGSGFRSLGHVLLTRAHEDEEARAALAAGEERDEVFLLTVDLSRFRFQRNVPNLRNPFSTFHRPQFNKRFQFLQVRWTQLNFASLIATCHSARPARSCASSTMRRKRRTRLRSRKVSSPCRFPPPLPMTSTWSVRGCKLCSSAVSSLTRLLTETRFRGFPHFDMFDRGCARLRHFGSGQCDRAFCVQRAFRGRLSGPAPPASLPAAASALA